MHIQLLLQSEKVLFEEIYNSLTSGLGGWYVDTVFCLRGHINHVYELGMIEGVKWLEEAY